MVISVFSSHYALQSSFTVRNLPLYVEKTHNLPPPLPLPSAVAALSARHDLFIFQLGASTRRLSERQSNFLSAQTFCSTSIQLMQL